MIFILSRFDDHDEQIRTLIGPSLHKFSQLGEGNFLLQKKPTDRSQIYNYYKP
jgi:hypothetical protein